MLTMKKIRNVFRLDGPDRCYHKQRQNQAGKKRKKCEKHRPIVQRRKKTRNFKEEEIRPDGSAKHEMRKLRRKTDPTKNLEKQEKNADLTSTHNTYIQYTYLGFPHIDILNRLLRGRFQWLLSPQR